MNHLLSVEGFAKLQDFITLFLSIVLEALPFVVLGVSVSVVIALFIPKHNILRLLPKNRILSHVVLSLFGIFLPVCECGNVPVARRLLKNGYSVSHAMTFLLAAPIINPVTFLTTWVAFSPDWSVVIIRMGAGLLIVNIVGIILSLNENPKSYLTKQFIHDCDSRHEDNKKSTFAKGVDIFQSEFLLIMHMLCLGALIAAATQSFIPRSLILSLGQHEFFSIIAMIMFAFVISVCSTIDAFIAVSYVGSFTLGSLVSFLVFGPMIDIKLLAMMKTIFSTKLLIFVVGMVTLLSILTGLIVNLMG